MPHRAFPILYTPLLLAATLALLPACEDRAGPATTPTSEDRPDPTASDSTATPRVAALLPFAADQLLALGVEPVLVPSLQGGQPEAWEGIEAGALDHSVGPNLEQLIAADPDVVVMSAVYAQFVPQIEQTTGARVITMDADTLEDVSTHTRTLGELVARQAEADRWVRGFNAQLAQAQPIESAGDPPSVLAVFGTPNAFYAFLPESYLGSLVEAAGGRLVTSDMPAHRFFRGLAPLSMEAVIEKDPDVLMVVFHGPEQAARALLDRDPLWSELSAVKGNHIAMLPDDLYAMRSGSQATVALEQIRTAIQQAKPE